MCVCVCQQGVKCVPVEDSGGFEQTTFPDKVISGFTEVGNWMLVLTSALNNFVSKTQKRAEAYLIQYLKLDPHQLIQLSQSARTHLELSEALVQQQTSQTWQSHDTGNVCKKNTQVRLSFKALPPSTGQ